MITRSWKASNETCCCSKTSFQSLCWRNSMKLFVLENDKKQPVLNLAPSSKHLTDFSQWVRAWVISHELGSHKELATLVNGLCKFVVVNSTCYRQTIDDLNEHYRNIWNRTMAALRLVYFRDPWRASSTVVGVAVLVFTIFNFCRIVQLVF